MLITLGCVWAALDRLNAPANRACQGLEVGNARGGANGVHCFRFRGRLCRSSKGGGQRNRGLAATEDLAANEGSCPGRGLGKSAPEQGDILAALEEGSGPGEIGVSRHNQSLNGGVLAR